MSHKVRFSLLAVMALMALFLLPQITMAASSQSNGQQVSQTSTRYRPQPSHPCHAYCPCQTYCPPTPTPTPTCCRLASFTLGVGLGQLTNATIVLTPNAAGTGGAVFVDVSPGPFTGTFTGTLCPLGSGTITIPLNGGNTATIQYTIDSSGNFITVTIPGPGGGTGTGGTFTLPLICARS